MREKIEITLVLQKPHEDMLVVPFAFALYTVTLLSDF